MMIAVSRLSRVGVLVFGSFAALFGTVGCVKQASTGAGAGAGGANSSSGDGSGKLVGEINVDGSSTVFPIMQAMSREFETKHPGVQIPVAGSGTTAGFKKFVNRESEISDASRPIKENEIALCKENGINYLELQLAIDGLSVVVNKENDWVDTITVAELRKIWDEGSAVGKWSDVRPEWPDEKIELFGPGTDSGTFDYFNEVINGDSKRCRPDYDASENDNILVTGVAGTKYALGYFGFAYYVGSMDKLKALKIAAEEGEDGVAPTPETVENGTYRPLSRPLFIYVNKESLQRPEVAAFVAYCLSDEGQDLVEQRKYIRMNPQLVAEMRQRLEAALPAR